MAYRPETHKTPWQKVQARFGMNASALAKAINRDRSKVSRHLRDERGLISGNDQALLIAAAQKHGINLDPSDLIPDVR